MNCRATRSRAEGIFRWLCQEHGQCRQTDKRVYLAAQIEYCGHKLHGTVMQCTDQERGLGDIVEKSVKLRMELQ